MDQFTGSGQTGNGRIWRRLRVRFPDDIATHSAVQTYYIDERGLIARHDYEVDIRGGISAARYLLDPVKTSGIVVPTKLRIYPRVGDHVATNSRPSTSIDLSKFILE